MTADQLLTRVELAYNETRSPDHPLWTELAPDEQDAIVQFSRALIVPLMKDVLAKIDQVIAETNGEANGG